MCDILARWLRFNGPVQLLLFIIWCDFPDSRNRHIQLHLYNDTKEKKNPCFWSNDELPDNPSNQPDEFNNYHHQSKTKKDITQTQQTILINFLIGNNIYNLHRYAKFRLSLLRFCKLWWLWALDGSSINVLFCIELRVWFFHLHFFIKTYQKKVEEIGSLQQEWLARTTDEKCFSIEEKNFNLLLKRIKLFCSLHELNLFVFGHVKKTVMKQCG